MSVNKTPILHAIFSQVKFSIVVAMEIWTGYIRSRHEVQVGSRDWAGVAAQSLEHNGFCVLRSPSRVAPPELCAQCAAVALSRLDQLLKAIVERGIDPLRDIFGFREVCKRHGGARYDVALPHAKPPCSAAAAAVVGAAAHAGTAVGPPLLRTADEATADSGDSAGPWTELQALVDATVSQHNESGRLAVPSSLAWPPRADSPGSWLCDALRAGHCAAQGPLGGCGAAVRPGRSRDSTPFYAQVQEVVAETRALRGAAVDRAGCVVSFPGTPAQQVHTDGASHGFFNCFVPLTPVDASNGTELLPGTHEPVEFALVELPWQDESQMEALTPSLAAGELLLFDYRLRHRGLTNTTAAPRPVAYFVYTCPGLSDTRNFPCSSVYAC